jgi:hypothetical protein
MSGDRNALAETQSAVLDLRLRESVQWASVWKPTQGIVPRTIRSGVPAWGLRRVHPWGHLAPVISWAMALNEVKRAESYSKPRSSTRTTNRAVLVVLHEETAGYFALVISVF